MPVRSRTGDAAGADDEQETVDAEDLRHLVGDEPLSATDDLILERLEERGRLLLLFPERIEPAGASAPRDVWPVATACAGRVRSSAR